MKKCLRCGKEYWPMVLWDDGFCSSTCWRVYQAEQRRKEQG